MKITYQEFMDSIEAEHYLVISDAIETVKTLLYDKEHIENDYDVYESYDNSTRKKLHDISRAFSRKDISYYGNANEYHNLAVDYSKHSMFYDACLILECGLKKFNSSVDLLADLIKYYANIGMMDDAEKAYDKLLKIPKNRWNWRAYIFVSDYLIDCIDVNFGNDRSRNSVLQFTQDDTINEAFKVADEYIKYAQIHTENIDKAYFQLAETISKLGSRDDNNETEEIVLLKGCELSESATRCALKLAELYFERGNYSESINFLNKSITAFSKPQLEIRGSYLYLLRAMSNTSQLLHDINSQNINFGDKKECILNIYCDFNSALATQDLPNEYEQAAKNTIKILETQSNIINEKNQFNDNFI